MSAIPVISQPDFKLRSRPRVLFFGLTYLLAWGTLAVLHLIARQSGIENGLILLQMEESFQFGDSTPSVAPWLIYLLTRRADFPFSIAGIVTIAITTGSKDKPWESKTI